MPIRGLRHTPENLTLEQVIGVLRQIPGKELALLEYLKAVTKKDPELTKDYHDFQLEKLAEVGRGAMRPPGNAALWPASGCLRFERPTLDTP